MNLTKREFMQVLGAGTMAGMALGTHAQADAATASNGLYDKARAGRAEKKRGCLLVDWRLGVEQQSHQIFGLGFGDDAFVNSPRHH